ncbi:hypothetical protein F4X90_09445 [Candidatus Poribacteria bacterium]|nr:hypothetical protein [Candidatus Poribacteria bacterium]
MKKRLISIDIKSAFLLLIGISILLVGCERARQQAGVLSTAPAEQAHAVIGSLNDSGVTGMAVFTKR